MTTHRTAIADALERGLTMSQVARELGLAPSTVAYHSARLRLPPVEAAFPSAQTGADDAIVRQVETRERVRALLAKGLTRAEIARRLGRSKGTISYHAGRLGASVDSRCARRYDWHRIQTYYDSGHSISACQRAFGFSRATWTAAVGRGAVVPRPARMPIEELCRRDTARSRRNLKRRLVGAGLKEDRCEQCGIDVWRGKPLALELHHRNGDRNDNRIVNLEVLCPNCHSQTANYAGRLGKPSPPESLSQAPDIKSSLTGAAR